MSTRIRRGTVSMEGIFTCAGNYWDFQDGEFIYYKNVRLVTQVYDYPPGFVFEFAQWDTLRHELTMSNHDPENGLDMDVVILKLHYSFSVKYPLL